MMKKSDLLNWVAATLLAGVAMMGGNAMAQTPDGETPANEGVCDVLKAPTVSHGLYGLCVAYCEAQDLDTFDKEPPNNKILDNYNKRKQAADPAMPCVKVPCPCWSADEIASISGDGIASACIGSTNKLQIIDSAPKTHFAEANVNAGEERCRYIDRNTSPLTLRNFSITPAEAASCLADVQAACVTTGL
jgi:hypothetical protein